MPRLSGMRITKAVPGRLIGNRFVPSRSNPQPLGKMVLGVVSLGTPAGVTSAGKVRKNPFDFTLQKKAYAADDRFQKALEKEYGSRAGEMRYKPDSTYPPHLRKLAKAKKAADEASHNYTTKYRRENPSIRKLKKELKRAGHPERLRHQVVRTAKGYARSRKLVARESRNPALPQDRWIPAKVKIKKGGAVDVLVVAAGRPNPDLMKPYPESHRMGLHVRANGVHSKAQAAKEFEAWYDYRKHHIDPAFTKAQFKAEFMRGWGKK
jgi:hypothetical protein